ncbi:MAG TPA: Ig-like domain-containing protein [Candidatus Dormibacteraeota bacterium]|nr:Ig-like domain-containing protein [Candidatus Dormibacteraeota bacterium]
MKHKNKRVATGSRSLRVKKTLFKSALKKSARRNPKKALAKQKIKRARPVHKRILLHPASVLILLCAGVFIAGWTIRSAADSYTITASVLAPLPPGPATIISPVDQTHYTTTPIVVAGSCPSNTYVELYRNGNFSGVASCGAGVTSYQINTDLSLGANDLYTRVFNITDNEGPQSAQITVFYDQPSTPPIIPSSSPGTLQVTSQDNKAYQSGNVAVLSPYPTISGVAPPNSKVTVTFHSNVITCITYADNNGAWSCTLDQPLEAGIHTISVSAVTPSGAVLYFPSYHMRVLSSVKPLHAVNAAKQPFLIKSDYRYQVYAYGQTVSLNLSLSGGVGPYAIIVSWGDGSQSTVSRKDQSAFATTHVYKPLGNQLRDYTIKVQAVDDNDAKALLQTTAVVRGSQIGALSGQCTPSAPTTGSYSSQTANTLCGNTASSLFSRAKQWLWVAWPTYAVVVLMIFSFWLGERQKVLALISNKQPKHRRRR